MKIAISTDGTLVAPHFGRCQQYTILEVQNNEVLNREVIQSPEHQPGFLPEYLTNMGVNCIICGGMGHRAQGLFAQYNIEVIAGVAGEIDKVIEEFLKGKLKGGKSFCDRGYSDHKSCKH